MLAKFLAVGGSSFNKVCWRSKKYVSCQNIKLYLTVLNLGGDKFLELQQVIMYQY